MKEMLHRSLTLLFRTTQNYFSYETFHYKYERKGARTVLRNLVEDDWGHEIFFDTLNILSRKSILTV